MKDSSNITDFFSDGGILSSQMEGYEPRSQQVRMAEAVRDSIDKETNLIVEAGTGTGKSLAYLVPLIYWAVREGRKVVISTYTKALQNQLYVKDLPFLSRILDIDFNYELCMGAGNYLCLRKAHIHHAVKKSYSNKVKEQHSKILKWRDETDTGLVTDLPFEPEYKVWDKFSREADMCLGKKCPFKDECFYLHSRYKQAQAHVIITNHALLFTDLVHGSRILPDYDALVLDEAHTVEDVATSQLGKEFNGMALSFFLRSLHPFLSDKNVGPGEYGKLRSDLSEVRAWIHKAEKASKDFFDRTEGLFGRESGVKKFDRGVLPTEDLCACLLGLSTSLSVLSRACKNVILREEFHSCAERSDNFLDVIDFIFSNEEKSFVYWLDVRSRGKDVVYSFHAAPVNVSGQMRSYLFERISPVILTSATLSSSSSAVDFSFVRKRLGLDYAVELSLDSPFDYSKNVLLYAPRQFPDPNSDRDGYKKEVVQQIMDVHDIMGGRIFALFTSYEMLNYAADTVREKRDDINILKQGDLPRYVLLDVFKQDPTSVLLGTSTFWQGVDVPGTSLECVIITKLPFAVPSDPINAARIREMEQEGRNAFQEYQIPRAIMMFRQGFGRLIRSNSDRGVVVILDPRVKTKFYGRRFLKSLPKCKTSSDIQDIRDFFEHYPGDLEVCRDI